MLQFVAQDGHLRPGLERRPHADSGSVAYDLGLRTWVDDGQNPDPIPEPATLMLLGVGLVGVRLARRR